MTLPTSGPLTLAMIAAEFGGTPPLSLANYRRGGAYVPMGTAAGTGSHQTGPLTPNAGPILIPTSGTIQLSHFYGTQSVSNPVNSGSLSADNTGNIATSSPLTATANCAFKSDGRTYTSDALGLVYHSNWYTPTSSISIIQNFWFRVTVTSGSLTTGGGVGTWQNLASGTDLVVGASAHTTGRFQTSAKSASGYIDVSLTNGGAIIGTWSFHCVSEIDSSA